MKLTLKEKAKLFWERNKVEIIGILAFIGVTAAAGIAIERKAEKDEEKRHLEAEAWKAEEDADIIVSDIDELKRADEAAIDDEDRIANDPNNQLTDGGYVAPDRNNLNEADCPNLLANCVPLTSMGQFGRDIIDLYKEKWPDWDTVGMFNPETAVADVYIDFCHEKWLEYQRGQEAESQEKQAS